jgi:hypothetical protein
MVQADRRGVRRIRGRRAGSPPALSSEQVWQQISKASFAVLGYVTPDGDPRSSGVLYATAGRRLYVAVAPDSWKARHIPVTGRVAVTVTVRRGGLLSLVFPIPPATISFHAAAVVHPPGALDASTAPTELAALVPAERRNSMCLIEVVPEGRFVTYGVGVPLRQMRDPASSRAHPPV